MSGGTFFDLDDIDRVPAFTGQPRWFDSLGREVDLDDIDREYALNILSMVLRRRALAGYTHDDLLADPLVQKLREVVLTGREPNQADNERARVYNFLNWVQGKKWRAPVR